MAETLISPGQVKAVVMAILFVGDQLAADVRRAGGGSATPADLATLKSGLMAFGQKQPNDGGCREQPPCYDF